MIYKNRTFENPFATKKFATILGHKMAYIDEGDGMPIIFQHGNPFSSYIWRNIMPHLKGMGRVIAPDLMGYGDSEKLPREMGKNRYLLSEQYNYFDKLIHQLVGDQKVVLVLHDCGSIIGFNWANHHRNQVLGITYMEAVVAPLKITDFPLEARNIDKVSTEMMEASLSQPNFLLEAFMKEEPGLTDKIREHYRAPFKKLGEDQRPIISSIPPVDGYPEDNYKIVAAYSKWMGENDVPKLLIKGEPGYMIHGRFYEICRQWKNQTEVVVKGRHMLQEVEPDKIGEAIREFVRLNNKK